jgi:predicted GIY-YIG superfamily endonuclease
LSCLPFGVNALIWFICQLASVKRLLKRMTPLDRPLGGSPHAPRWSAEDLGILNHFLVDSPVAGANRVTSSVAITAAACGNSAAAFTGIVSPLAASQARTVVALTASATSASGDRAIVHVSACDGQPEVLSKEERLRRKYQRRYKRRVVSPRSCFWPSVFVLGL